MMQRDHIAIGNVNSERGNKRNLPISGHQQTDNAPVRNNADVPVRLMNQF